MTLKKISSKVSSFSLFKRLKLIFNNIIGRGPR